MFTEMTVANHVLTSRVLEQSKTSSSLYPMPATAEALHRGTRLSTRYRRIDSMMVLHRRLGRENGKEKESISFVSIRLMSGAAFGPLAAAAED